VWHGDADADADADTDSDADTDPDSDAGIRCRFHGPDLRAQDGRAQLECGIAAQAPVFL